MSHFINVPKKIISIWYCPNALSITNFITLINDVVPNVLFKCKNFLTTWKRHSATFGTTVKLTYNS